MKSSRRAGFAFALACAWAAACGTVQYSQEPRPAPVAMPRAEANAETLVEQAADGTFVVPASQRVTVDANADLVLSFGSHGSLPEAAQQQLAATQELLDRVVAAGRERASILVELDRVARLAPGDERTAANKQVAERGTNNLARARQILKDLVRLGITQGEIDAELDRAPDGPEGAFAALHRLLLARQRALVDSASAQAASARKAEVAVQAFLDAVGRQRRQLHVDNYDTLPAGDYQPVPRLSVEMSPAERERFQLELQTSQSMAAGVRMLQQESLRPAIRELRQFAQSLVGDVAAATLADLRRQLREAQLPPAAQQRLQAALEAVLGKVEAVLAVRDQWQAILPKDDAPIDLFAVFDRLAAAVQATTAAGVAIKDLPAAVAALLADAELPATLAGALRAETDTAVARFLARIKDQQPKLDALRAVVEKVLGLFVQGGRPGAPKEAPPEIWHLLDEAPDARIELARSGITVGDSVMVKTHYRAVGSKDDLRTTSYKADAQLMGWHRQVSAELIFARADTGPGTAQDWAPNVAAVADLHYRCRDDSGARAVWNFLDPAFGVHLASLAQTDDTTEFGMGANLSFFGGFLTGGVGWNFSAQSDDAIYYFVGIDLFTVLQSARTL